MRIFATLLPLLHDGIMDFFAYMDPILYIHIRRIVANHHIALSTTIHVCHYDTCSPLLMAFVLDFYVVRVRAFYRCE